MNIVHKFFAESLLVLGLVLGLALNAAPAAAQGSAINKDELRRILREQPDILLDVLRENGDVLLDILQQASDNKRSLALRRQWTDDAKTPKTPSLDSRPSRGPEKAPITLVAFSDFTCSYCQNAAFTVETLLSRYPGQIRFVFKQVPAGDSGRLASQWFLAAYGLDQPKAWEFYAMLFDRQGDLVSDPVTVLRELTREVGLDTKAVEAAVKSRGKEIDEILNTDQAEAKELGFHGTPYFLVNNLIIRGALPLENFVDAVEFELGR